MPSRDAEDFGGCQSRRIAECIEIGDRRTERSSSSDVEPRARRSRDSHVVEGAEFLCAKLHIRGSYAWSRARVRPYQLDWCEIVDPFCAVQPRRGQPGEDTLPMRPQPTRSGAQRQGHLNVGGYVHVREHLAIARPQLVLSNEPALDGFATGDRPVENRHGSTLAGDTPPSLLADRELGINRDLWHFGGKESQNRSPRACRGLS